jgi:CubicO group peptidase (beta-lactamase class C family)
MAKGMFISKSFKPEITKAIKESRLGPKGKYLYSCINFILLKMMVEKQMGKSLDVITDENFFKPLGAWHTTYNPLHKMDTLLIVPTEKDDIVRNQWLRGYVHDEAAAIQGGVSGNAGLFSNANDLAKILQLYLNNGTYGDERLLSEETVKLFTQSKTPNSRRGLGFDKPNTNNISASPCAPSTPASVYGHTGYTGTAFWVDPDNGIIYIFLSNRVCPTRNNNKLGNLDIRTRIQEEIYKAIKQ